MTNDFINIVKKCRESIKHGMSSEDIILYLHQKGATITESMKVIRELYGLSLGEAKALVTAHPIWTDTVRGADVLHQEIGNALQKETELPHDRGELKINYS